jgi:hypothetical protein
MPSPTNEYRTWTRQLPEDEQTYTISTDPSLIQLDALNAAFHSDMVYWANPMSPEALKLCIEQSLCFGLYVQDGESVLREGGSVPREGGGGWAWSDRITTTIPHRGIRERAPLMKITRIQ